MGTHTYLEEALPPQSEGHTPRGPAGHLRSAGLAVPGAPGQRSRGAGGVPPRTSLQGPPTAMGQAAVR